MADAIALIRTRMQTTPLGFESRAGVALDGASVLQHTVARVARVGHLKRIVLLHEPGDDPMPLLCGRDFGVPVCGFASTRGAVVADQQKLAAARKWALAAWRGGLSGATCYDELLPADPMLEAMEHFRADSALWVGGDWPLVDSDYCRRVLELHLDHPQEMQLTFTQAPPGLAGIAVGRELVGQMVQNRVCIGQLIGYNPAKPQADPIGRDLCVQIPASVRGCVCRLIYDTPASMAIIDRLAHQLGGRFAHAGAEAVTEAVAAFGERTDEGFAHLPQMVTLELTPRRQVQGPITPQHHVRIERPDLPLDVALNILRQLGQDGDTVLTLGGLGDPLMHDRWDETVTAAKQAGVLGVALETDLLCDAQTLEKLLILPIDVVSVRLNADTTSTYQKVMDPGDELGNGFTKVIKNLEWLLNERNSRSRDDQHPARASLGAGLPWVVTRLVKTAETLGDLETFYDRWVYYAGHAVIEPFTNGCGLAPDLSPVRMDPPGRFACRQLARRMTIHADGRVARCDQDWLGRSHAGDVRTTPLEEIWRSMRPLRQAHRSGQWDALELCGPCHEWHRP